LIAWVDYRKTAFGDIWAQRYDLTGALGVNFQVNDVDNVANPNPTEFPYGPSVAAVPTSDATAADVIDRPIDPKDILCTAYHLLGVDPTRELMATPGRAVPLVGGGRVVRELLG
jgi:hypothetical protein